MPHRLARRASIRQPGHIEAADIELTARRNPSHGGAPVGQLGHERARSVDRIDVPGAGAGACIDGSPFLTDDPIAGEGPHEPLHDDFLRGAIRLGHERSIGFLVG